MMCIKFGDHWMRDEQANKKIKKGERGGGSDVRVTVSIKLSAGQLGVWDAICRICADATLSFIEFHV